jgi:phosphopentomutase
MKRAIVLVLDGVGIGELPDAADYGDQGSNTLGNLARACNGLHLPILESLGLGKINHIHGIADIPDPLACYGKMAEQSPGKDSTSGHWELFGIILKKPFPTYPNGFPEDIIKRFETSIDHKIIGNIAASGTEIIRKLGRQHLATKQPIVYTSADSVFQIACHTDVFSKEELYDFCKEARKILTGKHNVARVIARPFTGTAPDFYRTEDRRDFSIVPPEPTLLDRAKDKGYDVIAIGKIDELFGKRGYTKSFHSINDLECVDLTLQAIEHTNAGLIITNFVQFDMDWGHRNNTEGFKNGLAEIDKGIGQIMDKTGPNDILFITADHGNDPTTPSTDHSREYVPILGLTNKRQGKNIGIRKSFSDLARSLAHYLDISGVKNGEDFLDVCLS